MGGGEPFKTLSELIEHYKRNPMVETCGTVVHLRQPFNATRITAAGINARVEQLVKVSKIYTQRNVSLMVNEMLDILNRLIVCCSYFSFPVI